jgi:c(7)-type cytochrome triheme protein
LGKNASVKSLLSIAGFLLAVALLPFSFVFSQGANPDYSKFLHTSQQHAAIGCANCHHRTDNSSTPGFPGHKDCIECHRTEYHTADSPICFICHQDVNSSNPPRRAFPNQFKESFNVKFDHAQHMTGNARPKNGCASCHNASLRRGVAVSIPAGMGAHDGCYTCHTPDATANGREIASCGVCHDQKAFTRTSNDSSAYRIGFSHAQHSGRERLGCADCHNYTAGLPQRRQVSSPRALEHFPAGNRSCATCHNGKRTFGGDLDFKSCRRCHTGQTFRTGG